MNTLFNVLLIFAFVTNLSCSDAKYRIGDTICAYNTTLIINQVHTFAGTGGGMKGTNYTCRYVDNMGKIQSITLYEKEITNCKSDTTVESSITNTELD